MDNYHGRNTQFLFINYESSSSIAFTKITDYYLFKVPRVFDSSSLFFQHDFVFTIWHPVNGVVLVLI